MLTVIVSSIPCSLNVGSTLKNYVYCWSYSAVTFSRIEPGEKLVMGFRKATNTVSLPVSRNFK
jgi:hypothetical protein